jgi:hypothetical protein
MQVLVYWRKDSDQDSKLFTSSSDEKPLSSYLEEINEIQFSNSKNLADIKTFF